MRIGIVCPYSWDVPGGVQFHVRDLAEYFLRLGHHVSVLAPADDDTPLPPYVVSAGRAVPVPYNGSVARLNFGFLSAARVRRWLHEGAFDVVHIHEPTSPSLGLLTCWAASGPIVATFHTSNPRSRAMIAAYAILQAALEKISARIAVSEYARRTLVEHLGGDAVVIPNGVDVDFFAKAEPRPEWQGGTIGFIGRIDEPRKGLPVLMKALPRILAARPETRLLVAGRGDEEAAVAGLPGELRPRVEFLGMISDEDKARLLRSVDLYAAPNTGGESFGIILVEAMSAGAPVLASDLDAFVQVLDQGEAGEVFANEDADALAEAAVRLLGDPARLAELRARGSAHVRRFDWSTVGADILSVYETVTAGAAAVATDDRATGLRQLDRGLPAEDLDQALDLLGVGVDLVDGRLERGERAVGDGDRVADLEVQHLDLDLALRGGLALGLGGLAGGLLLGLRGEHLDDLVQGQRVGVVGVADEAGDARGVADDAPGLVGQVHADQDVTRQLVLLDRLAVAVLDLDDLFLRHLGLEDVVLDVQRDGALLQVGLHAVLVTGVGVDDVPLAGQGAQFLAQGLDRVDRGGGLGLGGLRDCFLGGLVVLALGAVLVLGVLGVHGGLLGRLPRLGLGSLELVLVVRALDDVELVVHRLGSLPAGLSGVVVQVRVRHDGCFFLDT